MTLSPDRHFCDPSRPPGACPVCSAAPRPYVLVDSWAGRRRAHVEALGATPKRVRIRFLSDACGCRAGDVRLVPPDLVQWPDGCPSAPLPPNAAPPEKAGAGPTPGERTS